MSARTMTLVLPCGCRAGVAFTVEVAGDPTHPGCGSREAMRDLLTTRCPKCRTPIDAFHGACDVRDHIDLALGAVRHQLAEASDA